MRKAQEHVEGGGREEEIIELRLKLKKKKETKPIRAQRGSDQIGTSQGRADWRLGAGANQSLIPGGTSPHSGDATGYDWLTRRHGTRGCVEPWMASCTVSTGVALTENGLASLIYTEYKTISMEYTPYNYTPSIHILWQLLILQQLGFHNIIKQYIRKNITGPHIRPTPVRHPSNRPCLRMHPSTLGSVAAASPRPSESGSGCVCLVSNSSLIVQILWPLVLLLPSFTGSRRTDTDESHDGEVPAQHMNHISVIYNVLCIVHSKMKDIPPCNRTGFGGGRTVVWNGR